MRELNFIAILFLFTVTLNAQSQSEESNLYLNTTEQFLESKGKLNIGGYGEVHYNQPLQKDVNKSGTLDVHRIVMFLGYNFSTKTQFVTEIEFEYAKETWIEQAFMQHKLNRFLNLRAGLMLVPMGIINEYHEPTVFHGVERPVIDNKISLSTWREVGAGIAGTILPASLKYQAYIMGGLNGYDTRGVFSGTNGLREGRQKGSKAFTNTPAFAGKIEFFGAKNLNIGLSAYLGNSQSRLHNNLKNDNNAMSVVADSSIVGISMIGADARYQQKGLELRGQFYLTNLSNTEKYNVFTKSAGKYNDLGSQMLGYYVEAAYNVLRLIPGSKYELMPFVRYEYYDMHQRVNKLITRNENYRNTIVTSGLTLKLHRNAVLKTDFQWIKSAAATQWNTTINAGIGVMF